MMMWLSLYYANAWRRLCVCSDSTSLSAKKWALDLRLCRFVTFYPHFPLYHQTCSQLFWFCYWWRRWRLPLWNGPHLEVGMNQSNPLIACSANPWPLIWSADCTHSFDGVDETVKTIHEWSAWQFCLTTLVMMRTMMTQSWKNALTPQRPGRAIFSE